MACCHDDSELTQAGRLGRRLDGEVVLDAHTHMGSHFNYYPLHDCTVEHLAADMDRHGVRGALTFSLAGVNSDFVYGNSLVNDMTAGHRDRFWPLCLVNPRYPDLIVPELERCAALGFCGVKLIAAYQQVPEDTPALDCAYAFAAAHHWIVLSHSWPGATFLYELARRHPTATFIDGHGGIAASGIQRKVPENVLFCTLTEFTHGTIERLVNHAPVEQIVFGSDMPDLPIAWGLGAVLMARISDEAKRKILGLNLSAALDRHGLTINA